MNNLNKLIEQYERENPGCFALEGDMNGNCDFYRDFVLWLATRPTCGHEQRKFLDVIERKGKFDKTNLAITVGEDGDSVMLGSDFYLLDVGRNQKDYVNLEEVIKGE